MNKAHLQYSTPSSSKLSRTEEHARVVVKGAGGGRDHELPADPSAVGPDADNDEDDDRFQDYYGLVAESRLDQHQPEQALPHPDLVPPPTPASINFQDEQLDQIEGEVTFSKHRETPRQRPPSEIKQRAASPV